MDIAFRDRFLELWEKHFDDTELPISFYYTDEPAPLDPLPPAKGHACIMAQLARVRKGQDLCFNIDSIGCFGGKKYLGFTHGTMPGFEYFLSYGIPGEMEGERYKKTPEMVQEIMKNQPQCEAPARHIVFKRWDQLAEADQPEVVIFLATPDVLSGLFTLSGFDETDSNAVIAPFGAGCATIVQRPYVERERERPRSVLGMLDVSARPYVPPDALSFATPMAKFRSMVDNMDESFLITKSWAKVRRRIHA